MTHYNTTKKLNTPEMLSHG